MRRLSVVRVVKPPIVGRPLLRESLRHFHSCAIHLSVWINQLLFRERLILARVEPKLVERTVDAEAAGNLIDLAGAQPQTLRIDLFSARRAVNRIPREEVNEQQTADRSAFARFDVGKWPKFSVSVHFLPNVKDVPMRMTGAQCAQHNA